MSPESVRPSGDEHGDMVIEGTVDMDESKENGQEEGGRARVGNTVGVPTAKEA
jgi:hypothetical protein